MTLPRPWTLATMAILLAACGASSVPAAAKRADGSTVLQVVTTVAPITSIVSQIGGDRITLNGCYPPVHRVPRIQPPPRTAPSAG